MKKHLYQSNRFQEHELTQQPIAFIYFLSVEDKDPLGAIERLRMAEMLPKQYRSGIYDNSSNTVNSFVFILNDYADQSRYAAARQALAN